MTQDRSKSDSYPPQIRSTLARLRTRIRSYLFARGVALVVLTLGIAYWFALVVDYLPAGLGLTDLPWTVRAFMLLIAVSTAGYIGWYYLLQPTLVRMSDRSLALLLERRHRTLDDSLVTSVELSKQPENISGYALEMFEATQNQATRRLPEISISSVLAPRPLLVAAVGATTILLSWLLFAIISPSNFALSAKRLVLLDNEPWPRACHLEQVGVLVQRDYELDAIPNKLDRRTFEDGQLKVAKGSRFALLVQAEAPSESNPNRRLPRLCQVRAKSADGSMAKHSFSADGPEQNGYQTYRYEGDPFIDINESLTLWLKGGDHRLQKHRVQVVEAPSIISTQLDCQFPGYLVDPETGSWTPRQITWPYPDALPANTNVTLECQTNKRVTQIFAHRLSTDEDLVISLDEEGATQFQIPLGELLESELVEIALLDEDQVLSTNRFSIDIKIAEDQVPSVRATITGIGSAVTPNVRIPLQGSIEDDYGIDDAWLEVQATGLDTFIQDVNRLPDNQFESTLDFLEERRKQESELILEANDEQRLTLRIKAQDKFNLDNGTHIGESETFSLRIVSESELLAMLNRAEVGQRQMLEQIYREMQDGQLQILQARVEETGSTSSSETTEAPSDESDSDTDDENATPNNGPGELQGIPLNRLFAARALRQAEKSMDELNGVYEAFMDIRLQLINNRIDAPARKERLEKKVTEPLKSIHDNSFPNLKSAIESLDESLRNLEINPSDASMRTEAIQLANESNALAQQVIDEIDAVLVQLIDIEDDSRLMEIVRQMIEQQEKLLEDTEAERKKQGLRDLIGN